MVQAQDHFSSGTEPTALLDVKLRVGARSLALKRLAIVGGVSGTQASSAPFEPGKQRDSKLKHNITPSRNAAKKISSSTGRSGKFYTMFRFS
jgi:hypothetical protein